MWGTKKTVGAVIAVLLVGGGVVALSSCGDEGSRQAAIGSKGAAKTPSLTIGDASVTEGSSGTTDLKFTITRNNAGSGTSSVLWSTGSPTVPGASVATPGSDYVQVSAGTPVTFASAEVTKTVVVKVVADTLPESQYGSGFPEIFAVNLSSPTGATLEDAQAIGTIIDDDKLVLQGAFKINDVEALEGTSAGGFTPFTFTISRMLGADGAAQVTFETVNNGADAGADYRYVPPTVLKFADKQVSQKITVYVVADKIRENPSPPQSFFVKLTNPIGAGMMDGYGIGTITDDD